MWFLVMAVDSSVYIELTDYDCTIGNGLQLALYPSCDAPPLGCYYGIGAGVDMVASITAKTQPGNLYILLVDGFAGDLCSFTIKAEGLSNFTGPASVLEGEVRLDLNGNCQTDSLEVPLEGIPVSFFGKLNNVQSTNAQGHFEQNYPSIPGFEVGVSIGNLFNDYWIWCPDTIVVVADSLADTTNVVFHLQPVVLCEDMRVEIGVPPFFRPCQESIIKVDYANWGTVTAQDATVLMVLPSSFQILSADKPFTRVGDTLLLELGDVPPLYMGRIALRVVLPCNNNLNNQTLCLEARVFPDSSCTGIPAWSGAQVALAASCEGDSLVQFIIENVGSGSMQYMQEYIIIEDEVVLRHDSFQLNAGQSMVVEVPADGSTWRLETGQEPGFPGLSMPSLSIEGCGGLTPGLVNAWPQDDRDLFKDVECRLVRASYDPNIKVASPEGVGQDQLIRPNTPIEYTIHFQNTGNDTAFYVRLEDALPPELDASTFRAGAASHPHTWQIRGGDTLVVLFDPIVLPDSATNEPASQGWFEFHIQQQPNLPNGTLLDNQAAIYFDFNKPVITDFVRHTVGKLTVRVDDLPPGGERLWDVFGNPLNDRCTFVARQQLYGTSRMELYDVQGRLLQVHVFEGDRFELSRNALNAGTVVFRLISAKTGVFSGKIVVE